MWILFTILAVILQSYRNLEQRELNKRLDALTTAWSRFILPLPLALIVIFHESLAANPLIHNSVSQKTILILFLTAICQTGGVVFLIKAISSQNFSIGIALVKTETLQSAIIGWLFFQAEITKSIFSAIILASLGVILMSDLWPKIKNRLFSSNQNPIKKPKIRSESLIFGISPAVLFGLFSGLCFSFSGFFFKNAQTQMLDFGGSHFAVSLISVFWLVIFQNLFFTTIKLFQGRIKRDLVLLLKSENRRHFLIAGLASFSGSICWAAAFSFGEVLSIKVLSQAETLLAILISKFWLKEAQNLTKTIGVFITLAAILLVLF